MVSAGTGSPCLLALPPSQPWFFPIKLVAGIQREVRERRKGRPHGPPRYRRGGGWWGQEGGAEGRCGMGMVRG